MSVSYGAITITDTTDLGQLSVYLTANTVRQQIYDQNNGTTTFYPDWSTGGAHLLVTPHVYFNGQSKTITDNNITITWEKEEEGTTYSLPVSPTTDRCPEIVNNKILERPTNLYFPDTAHSGQDAHIIGTGATYRANIRYYPISGDNSVYLEGVATLDITIANNGIDGQNGQPGQQAKLLQLVSDGSYFTYRYDGTFFGSPTITLTVQKNEEVSGVHWYCKSSTDSNYVPIIVIGGNPSTDSTSAQWATAPYFAGESMTIAGESTSGRLDILDLVPDFITDRGAQFKIVEINSGGTEINQGLIDFTSIYALVEAAPGTDTYSSYLSNDEETIIDLNGSPILDNAQTQLFISQGGVDDLQNWHITVSDSVPSASDFVYTLSNSKDSAGSSTNLNKYGPDKVKVDAMNVNAALITFTAVHGTYDVNNQFTPDSEVADIIKTFSLTKSAAIISHSLRLDAVNAVRAAGNTVLYTPSTITVDAITRTGGGTTPYHNQGVIKATIYYTDGTTATQTNSADNALILDLNTLGASKTINYIDTTLGGTAAQLYADADDKQKITISSDGIDGDPGAPGTSPWNFMISNQFDAISTDFANKTSRQFVIKIPVAAAHGITPETIHLNGQTYPTISGGNIMDKDNNPLSNITPLYYNGDTEVTTAGSTVTNIRYTIPANTNITTNGSITLTLNYEQNKTITQIYTYKAQPEALKPVRVLLATSPTDTFENQEGTITITPTVLSGTDQINPSYWGNLPSGTYEWEVFKNNVWVNATSITGISVSNHVLSVLGTAVEGYLGLRFNVVVSRGGTTEAYTEYVNLKDIDDPLQVALHSTIGEQIVNGQGVGVIYARVIRRGDEEDYDTVAPDNMLAVGTSAPTASTASGKTGYCHVYTSGNNVGKVDYYWRTSGSGSWSGPRGNDQNPYKYKYTWYFRDNNNVSYSDTDSTPGALRYLLKINSSTQERINNQQFVYLDASVVSNKLTAIAKVEL